MAQMYALANYPDEKIVYGTGWTYFDAVGGEGIYDHTSFADREFITRISPTEQLLQIAQVIAKYHDETPATGSFREGKRQGLQIALNMLELAMEGKPLE